ncbi:hypothetical protein AAF712_001533 [Marasmius tenuissimus]|uniref:F-box domain-containing protein n=1 Tax=Marasmius tenuissimus TaxID=585030 RepID=A0ABR3ACJ0_9AGAR
MHNSHPPIHPAGTPSSMDRQIGDSMCQVRDRAQIQLSVVEEEDAIVVCTKCGSCYNEEHSPLINPKIFREAESRLQHSRHPEINRSWILKDEAAVRKIDSTMADLRRALYELEGRKETIVANRERRTSLASALWKLPVEVLGRVFIMACEVDRDEYSRGAPWEWGAEPRALRLPKEPIVVSRGCRSNRPGVLGRVCYFWRQVVLTNATLWSRYVVQFGDLEREDGIALSNMLDRSRGHKLSFHILGDSFWGEALNWDLHAELGSRFAEALSRTETLSYTIRNPRSFTLNADTDFRSLRNLRLTHDTWNHDFRDDAFRSQIRRLLRAEQITHLELDRVVEMDGHTFHQLQTILVSNPMRKDEFLSVVKACPNLESLVFAINDWEENIEEDGSNVQATELNRLLTLCSWGFRVPDIRQAVGELNTREEAGGLSKLFVLTPHAESLRIVLRWWEPWGTDKSADDLWTLLGMGKVLPTLSSLKVHVGYPMEEYVPPGREDGVARRFVDTIRSRLVATENVPGLELRSAYLYLAVDIPWPDEQANMKTQYLRLSDQELGAEALKDRHPQFQDLQKSMIRSNEEALPEKATYDKHSNAWKGDIRLESYAGMEGFKLQE